MCTSGIACLLRKGIKILRSFYDFKYDRIKVLPEILIKKLNMSAIACITTTNSEDELEKIGVSLKGSAEKKRHFKKI